MGSIANDIIKSMIKSKLQQNINDFAEKSSGLKNLVLSNVKKINQTIASFVPTEDIAGKLLSFKHNLGDFVLQFDKSYKDGSNILEGIQHVFRFTYCVRGMGDLLKSLDIPSWEDVDSLTSIPRAFSDFTLPNIPLGIIDRIYSAYSYPEFNIGVNLGTIIHNANAFNVISLISSAVSVYECLSEGFDTDSGDILQKIYGNLNKSYLTNVGKIDYSRLSAVLPSSSVDAIKEVQKGTQMIIHDTFTSVSKTFKESIPMPFSGSV